MNLRERIRMAMNAPRQYTRDMAVDELLPLVLAELDILEATAEMSATLFHEMHAFYIRRISEEIDPLKHENRRLKREIERLTAQKPEVT